jgi:ABC-type bacteriocin/lantibiotic exporter with double-glycine peptidase domain
LSSPPKEAAKPPKIQRLKAVWPEVWKLMRPRRGLLAIGFLLMVINKFAGFVLPYASKFLIDGVVTKGQTGLLRPLVFSVLIATLIQGITSFSLTQLLSKAAQRLIAELREEVQKHISRLPVAFYDANKTGALVSRIMSDVEGVRNLLGTGLVDFCGGIVAASIALVLLLRTSVPLTLIAVGSLSCFALVLSRAFKTIRPIFRERGKINAEVTGRLTESLGGVRVVKGYHAEEREEKTLCARSRRRR